MPKSLQPYGDAIATKAGLAKAGWVPMVRPERLIQRAHIGAPTLQHEQVLSRQLYRVEPNVSRGKQFGAVKTACPLPLRIPRKTYGA